MVCGYLASNGLKAAYKWGELDQGFLEATYKGLLSEFCDAGVIFGPALQSNGYDTGSCVGEGYFNFECEGYVAGKVVTFACILRN